jgi:hypothetical protein
MCSRFFRIFIFVGAAFLTASVPLATNAVACSTILTVNLTVQLETDVKEDVLIELRQGVVGHSKVVNKQKFHGSTGTVVFTNLCAGSYFMDIGNGAQVAVTPVHQFGDNERRQSTIKVTLSKGNVEQKSRNEL